MDDLEQIEPSIYEYGSNPLFTAVINGGEPLLRVVKLATESDCPRKDYRKYGDHIISNAMVNDTPCASFCDGIVWRFEVPIKDGKIPDTLDDIAVERNYSGERKYEFYDRAREGVMASLGKTYAEVLKYLADKDVNPKMEHDRTENPSQRVTEYYLGDKLQARITNICGLYGMDKSDDMMNGVNEVYDWVKRKGVKYFHVFDGEEKGALELAEICKAHAMNVFLEPGN